MPSSSSPSHNADTDAADLSLLRRLRHISTASFCDADKSLHGATPPSLYLVSTHDIPLRSGSPLAAEFPSMAGTARTVRCPAPGGVGDYLPMAAALCQSSPGEVLVVDASESDVAVAGGLFATEAARRGLAGIVIDGPCRDLLVLRSTYLPREDCDGRQGAAPHPFPFYARTVSPRSGTSTAKTSVQQGTVIIGGVEVRPGDVIVGDADGIIVGCSGLFRKILMLAEAIERKKYAAIDRMRVGEALSDLLNVDDLV